jgi:hypothetical protein
VPDDIGSLLGAADGERALPEGVAARLEDVLTGGGVAIGPAPRLRGIDHPREIPAATRARLERALMPQRRESLLVRALAIAAALTLIASGTVTALRSSSSPSAPTANPAPASGEAGPSGVAPAAPGSMIAPPSGGVAGIEDGVGLCAAIGCDPKDLCGTATPREGCPETLFSPPPFTYGDYRSVSLPSGNPYVTQPAIGAVDVGVVQGDAGIEAGFRAYVNALNSGGGLDGRKVRVVAVAGAHPAASTIATFNASAHPVATASGAPSWVKTPLIETLSAPDEVLRGNVFGFASDPVHQAHLIAARIFDGQATGATAVIYINGAEPFSNVVPDALEEALEARGVTVLRVAYDPDDGAPVLIPADAAFLSMGAAAMHTWLDASGDYAPARGVAAFYPALDTEARAPVGRSVRFISPYALPGQNELAALDRGAGAVNAATIHGWVSAKMLAVAAWKSRGQTTLTDAMEDLAGYVNGFCSAYAVRAGTRSRVPDGVEMKLTDEGVYAVGSWATDRN